MERAFIKYKKYTMTGRFCLFLIALFVGLLPMRADTFEISEGKFILDGVPFVVKAAELHYPRIPREYWDHRIKMVKALGMNTVCLYVFWNAHEPMPDRYDFKGNNDLREFVRLCDANGMKVILRPGPYVCAEWEMGGLPWWLLCKEDIRLRESDPYFLERVAKFEEAVAAEVADLTCDNGGPIIMVQVENEYGSYGTDKPYVSAIRDMLRRNFGEKVMMFQCDWSSNFLNNGLDDLLWTLNFGTGSDVEQQFAPLREVRPDSPLMCSEYWSGWFDKWGARHETRPADEMIAGIDDMLSRDISFSLYMTHGGTSFGHWAGANSPGFAPDVTSYDYDAPINEQGAPTPKYHALRETMRKYSATPLPSVPDTMPVISIPTFEFSEVAPLFSNLPSPIESHEVLPMEMFNQGYGSVLYRTVLPALPGGTLLTVTEPHDYARIFVNGSSVGTLDRRLGEKELRLPAVHSGDTLDILVEAMGRINFGRAIKDYKGITEEVTVTGPDSVVRLTDWSVYLMPDSLEFYTHRDFKNIDSAKRCRDGRLPTGVYRGSFTLDKTGDTFLNFESFGKGLVYVNGHPLGRIWEIGPQQTLYVPGPWLREGLNEVIVFDILGPRSATAEGMKHPIYDKLPFENRKTVAEAPELAELKPALAGTFPAGSGWKEMRLDTPATGRKLILEMLTTHDGTRPAIAELYLLDREGKRLPREEWSVSYVSGEDAQGGNHTADKAFDLQESTWWQPEADAPTHQVIAIDLGGEYEISAVQYLPRLQSGTPGAVERFNLFITE